MRDWIFKLTIQEEYGPRSYSQMVKLPVTTFGERLAGEMALGLAFVGPDAFDQTVTVLKEKKFRRDEIEHAARVLARMLCDHLEDAEGWHGEQRQERVIELGNLTPGGKL